MIRALVGKDREAVTGLLRATGNFTPAELAIAEELMGITLNQPDQTDYYSFVTEIVSGERPEIVGFLILGPVPATVGSWHMYWLAVRPDHHGTGAAQVLQQYAEEFVRRRGGYWLLAETSGQPGYERARAFYRQQGYRELARVADYYKLSDDLFLFGKRLGTSTEAG
jgi:ribosomal protein S18 acetylase RimI-like enzyme